MKKIFFTLIALIASVSMNAQVMKVYKGTVLEATYTGPEYKVVFEEDTSAKMTQSASAIRGYENCERVRIELNKTKPSTAISLNDKGTVWGYIGADNTMHIQTSSKSPIVIAIADAFYRLENAETIDGLENTVLDPNLTSLRNMFSMCGKLKSLNLSTFDTRNVTNMYHMFFECQALGTLDISTFDTRNVTNMDGMFADCLSLSSLDLYDFDTRNVTSMKSMFEECWNLSSLTLSHHFIVAATAKNMFLGCGANKRGANGKCIVKGVTDQSLKASLQNSDITEWWDMYMMFE